MPSSALLCPSYVDIYYLAPIIIGMKIKMYLVVLDLKSSYLWFIDILFLLYLLTLLVSRRQLISLWTHATISDWLCLNLIAILILKSYQYSFDQLVSIWSILCEHMCVYKFCLCVYVCIISFYLQAKEVYDDGAAKKLFLSRDQRSLYNVDRLTGKPWWDPEELPYQNAIEVC